jgi:methylated-DNA-[protein]-cysteine S-methyltransferase
MDSPLGPICLTATDGGLTRVDFQNGERPVKSPLNDPDKGGVLAAAVRQLQAYFDGTGQRFTVPLAPAGTAFQQRVWQALQQIPCGTTITYQELAYRVGSPKGARAVGSANGCNPIAIIIPCHRVLGRDGRLRGYAGGLCLKRRLLQHEGAWLL